MSMIWLVERTTKRLVGIAVDQVTYVGHGQDGTGPVEWPVVRTRDNKFLFCDETPAEIRAIMAAVNLDDRYNSFATVPGDLMLGGENAPASA